MTTDTKAKVLCIYCTFDIIEKEKVCKKCGEGPLCQVCYEIHVKQDHKRVRSRSKK